MIRNLKEVGFVKAAICLACLFVTAGAALATWMIFIAEFGKDSLQGQVLLLLLQFLLITGLGGIVAAVLTYARDAQVKAEETRRHDAQAAEATLRLERRDDEERQRLRIEALQAIDGELSRSYRRFKILKRQLRAQILSCDRTSDGIVPPFQFGRTEFEARMNELADAQIRLECLRDDLRWRHDLLDKGPLELIRNRLHYAARFYHDVFEDFERGKVRLEQDHYYVDNKCVNLANLLGNGMKHSDDLPKEIAEQIEDYFAKVKSGSIDRSVQHDLLYSIDQKREELDPLKRRTRAIADDCFALASAEIRQRLHEIAKMQISVDERVVSNRSYDVPLHEQEG